MELLRFITAGSVDDGKSTLIGRLLYDTEAVQVDLLEAIRKSSEQKGDERVNLALLTDGLKAEREQGITIDVAYKYFSTEKRKFIIADTPGHVQYTRNMVTGASTAELALLLVDARNGLMEQTRRHTFLASLVGVPHIVLCVNKMDLVDYDPDCFARIRDEYTAFARELGLDDILCIPVNALDGDNVVHRSKSMAWYDGPTVLEHLENVEVAHDVDTEPARLPVQYVLRPQSRDNPDYRGYAGQIVSGVFRNGDAVRVVPAGIETRITQLERSGEPIDEAWAPMSVTMCVAEDLDISRGDLIAKVENAPFVAQEFQARVCWMDERPLKPRGRYLLQINTRREACMVSTIDHRINIASLEPEDGVSELHMNDIAQITIKTPQPIYFDDYRSVHRTGSFILIDEGTNTTVAAGMIKSDSSTF